MLGIQTLTIGYTKDIELAEEIARQAGAKELSKSQEIILYRGTRD